MTNDRDDLVGNAVRNLDVPEHGEHFFDDLHARLDAEGRLPRATRRSRWTSPYLLGAAAAAVAAFVLAASLLSPDTQTRPAPRLITAVALRARVATALASLKTLKGELAVDERGATRRWTFATTAAGDERVTGIGTVDDTAFNAATRTWREVHDFGGNIQASETTNAAPGAPDAFALSPLRRNFASVVRAFITDDSDVPITEVVEDGRKAWRLATPVTPNKLAGPGGSGDRLEVIVDRASGFPLRITESLEGNALTEVRLSHLSPDMPIATSEFVLTFPTGVKVFRQDAGFRSVTRDQAASIVGYRPILPTALPDGFTMGDITVAAKGGATGTEGMNPPAPGVVSVAYRRGFDRIVVSTRLRGGIDRCAGDGTGASACWADPVSSGEGFIDEPRPFVIGNGVLAGAKADLVVSPRGVPHVWALGDRLVVTVSGDASAQELRAIAESFAP